jgi:spermidine/putrescine transport system substrate-binding protein
MDTSDQPREPDGHPTVDPAWVRGMTQRRLSRRDVLRLAAAGGGSLAASGVLAACGVSGGKAKKTSQVTFWTGKKQAGTVTFANWPYYIDKPARSLKLFTQQTGITVHYKEVIEEMPSFYGKIQPVLAAGQPTGYDIIVLTNGVYLDKAIQANYLIPLDHSLTPNFNKYAGPAIKNPSYDRGNKYTMAWQSGITGIGWNPKYVKKAPTSFNDLFNPAYKGKIGMFADNADLPNLALLGIGVDCEKSTPPDWQKAADKLKAQRPLVRKYYEQDYIGPLSKGDIWISMAWSGDIFQANLSNPKLDLQFVVPEEGGLIWTDNMCIPLHVAHPVDAIKLMDWVYDPKVAALITEGIQYITPVPACSSVIQQDAAKATGAHKALLTEVAKSQLVFPTSDMTSKVHDYRVLNNQEEKQWNSIFEPIYQG